MKNKEFQDVEYERIEPTDECRYYSATQIADILNENPTTIYNWVKQDIFGDLLGIKMVNGRRVYTKKDIENLKFIKELRKKNYSINQTKDYLSKRGFKYSEYDAGLIDTKDPLGFQALAISIAQENNKKFAEFSQKQEAILKEFGVVLLQEVKSIVSESEKNINSVLDEVCLTLDCKLPDMLNKTKVEIENLVDKEVKEGINTIPGILNINNNHLKDSINTIVADKIDDLKKDMQTEFQKQLEENRQGAETISDLRLLMEERSKKNEEEKNRGFFKKLFKR